MDNYIDKLIIDGILLYMIVKKIYLDNAATSWPKPNNVIIKMTEFQNLIGGNPGRSGHSMSVEAARIVYRTREKCAELFNVDDPLDIVFTKNATEAMNIATLCILEKEDHVIVSGMEHNALMRPLRYLEQKGLMITVVQCSSDGSIDISDYEKSFKRNTKAVYCIHASNVNGQVMPLKKIGEYARKRDLIFCVDAAQSAGELPICVKDIDADILIFTGHKSMYGPQGTGGLYISKRISSKMRPLIFGGTGSRSESELQPDFMPDKFESGTINAIGISGLLSGIEFILNEGISSIHRKKMALINYLIRELSMIPNVKIIGNSGNDDIIPIISFNIEGMSPSDVSFILDDRYSILVREGLHCAPAAHRTLGTFPEGSIRLSPGYFSTEHEIEMTVDAIRKISENISK
jgi:cysteine desulfurase family protein